MNKAMHLHKNRGTAGGQHRKVVFWCAVFTLLLFLRDVYAININKYILVMLTAVAVFTMGTRSVIYFTAFVMPLYVGLPGNYMTLVIFARFLVNYKKLRFKASSLILAVQIAFALLIHNIAFGYTGVTHMMLVVSAIMVLLLFSVDAELRSRELVLFYAYGVAALGVIMLLATLREYALEDLLSSSMRLGSSSISYGVDASMRVSMDPNFYGMFAITAIATGIPQLTRNAERKYWLLLLTALALIMVVAFIGLSRAFFLVLLAWLVLYLFSINNVKGAFFVLMGTALAAILVVNLMPDVLEALLLRFAGTDMETGNGRIRLIKKFWELWSENAFTVMFGVGLFDCNVHAMPLQYLFGCGIVPSAILLAFAFSLGSTMKLGFGKNTIGRMLPMVCTLVMSCTVPAAALLNFMYPVIFIGQCANARRFENR